MSAVLLDSPKDHLIVKQEGDTVYVYHHELIGSCDANKPEEIKRLLDMARAIIGNHEKLGHHYYGGSK